MFIIFFPKNMGCQVLTYHISSPIGKIAISGCLGGLHHVKQIDWISDKSFLPNPSQKVELVEGSMNGNVIEEAVYWLQVYFTQPYKVMSLGLPRICGSSYDKTHKYSFHKKVWSCLARDVGVGQTITNGDLAKLVSNPGAARAVGMAMSANPIQIIVPCHRVIRSDGSLGKYAKGNKNSVNKWILQFEGAI